MLQEGRFILSTNTISYLCKLIHWKSNFCYYCCEAIWKKNWMICRLILGTANAKSKTIILPRRFSKIPVLTPRASEQPSRTEYISGICFLKTLDARSPFNTGKQTEVSLLPAALQVYNGLCLCSVSRVSDVCMYCNTKAWEDVQMWKDFRKYCK